MFAAVQTAPPEPDHWTMPERSLTNMSILVALPAAFSARQVEVAALGASGLVAGVGVSADGLCGLAVWGDDPTTATVEGLQPGATFKLVMWDEDNSAERELLVESIQIGNGLTWEADGVLVVETAFALPVPESICLSNASPNPFNALTRLQFGVPQSGLVSLKIYDIRGREVATLIEGSVTAGYHEAIWDASASSAGVYFARLSDGAAYQTRKLTLVK
jgi:hypothetical protein